MKRLMGFFLAWFIALPLAYGIDVNGELKKAQLEKLSSDPTGVTGRVIFNTTSALPKYYSGAAWYSFAANPMTAVGDVIVGGTVTNSVAAPTRLAHPGAANRVLKSTSTSALGYAQVVDADVDSAAAIARSKVAAGTADHVVINAATTGVLSSEAQLDRTRGGTGISSTATFPSSGTVTTTSSKLSAFAATSSSELAGVISDETGSGLLVFGTTPTLTTPVLGVATATSVNKMAITAPATASTLAVADGKTLTASNTLMLTGTDGSSAAFGTGGTVAYQGGTLAQFAATTSSQLAGVLSDEQGTGAAVFASSPTLTTPEIATITRGSGSLVMNTTGVITVPNATTNLVGRSTTDTLTNKTLTSPTLTTPDLGVATATSINKVTITAPATSATITVADGKTFTSSNTLTATASDGSTAAFGAGGTVAYQGGTLAQFAATTSAQLLGVLSDETGSGAAVFATSPTLATPTIGVATATSVNKVAITAPATSATLTIADGKTATVSNTLTFTGTDASSVNFGAGGVVAYSSAANFTATNSITASYTVLDADGYRTIVATTAPSNVTASTRSSDTVTFSGAHGMITGAPILYNGTGTAIGGLTAGTVYYAIVTSSTAAKFATTITNALAGTAVALSGSVSPTSTCTPGIAVILPTDSDNTDRQITVVANYATATTSYVAVIAESGDSSTIGGQDSVLLQAKGDRITVQDSGSTWNVIELARKPITASYSLTGATATASLTTASAAVTDFNSSNSDSHSSVTSGASWNFKAKRAGQYAFTVAESLAVNTGWGIAEAFRLDLRKNGTGFQTCRYANQVACSSPCAPTYLTCASTVTMAVGDTFDVLSQQNSGGTIAYNTGGDDCIVTISEVSSPDVL